MNTSSQQVALSNEQEQYQAPTVAVGGNALILDESSMDRMFRLAEIMSKGKSTIPDHLKNNVGDCMAIVMQAVNWRMNPYAVAQKTHTVNGALGYEAQLVNAVIQSSGVTVDRFHYDWYGPWEKIIGKTKVIPMPAKEGKKAYEFRVPDYSMADEAGLGIRVWATLKGEDEPRVLDLLLVQASVRNSPLWASDPKQQLAYLAVKRWTRLYSPDVILGVYTHDELDDGRGENEINPRQSNQRATPQSIAASKAAEAVGPSEELLRNIRFAADNGRAAFDRAWKALSGAERGSIRGELDDFKARCERFDQRAAAETVPTKDVPQQDNSDFVNAMDKAEGDNHG